MTASGGSQRTPADVVEALGYGRAQVRSLVLGHGIWFVEAMQLSLSVVLTVYVATTKHWTKTQRASLQSVLFVGIAVGSVCGGYVADRHGRRAAILACYALASAVQLLLVISGTYGAVVVLRLLLGFAHGMGMPSSLALVNESTPAGSRVIQQALRNILFIVGQILAAVITIVDDATYRHMSWRVDLFLGAVPSLLLLLCAAPLLHDSPTLLAILGRDAEARQGLEAMRYLNGRDGRDGRPAVDVGFAAAAPGGGPRAAAGPQFRQQVGIIFGRHLLPSTITLGVASFGLNCVLYGHLYAFPLVATAEAREHSMPPAVQGLIQAAISIVINLAVLAICTLVSRQRLLSLGCLIGVLGMLGFALTGGIHGERSGGQSFVYYVSQNLPSVCCSCGFLAVYQLSVDLYPVEIAATSAALIVVCGRVGSISVAYIFEAFPAWQGFYYFLAALCLLICAMERTFLASGAAVPGGPEGKAAKAPQQEAAPRGDVEAARPLLPKQR